MILPAWQTDISQSQVMDALNFTGTPQTAFSLLWSSSMETASTATTINCLMYHNLAMGSTNSQTAKVAIYDNYAAGTNFNLGNWASYNSNPNIILTWTITNNNIDNVVNGTLYLVDAATFTQNSFYNFTVFNGGGTDNQTDYDTGISVSTLNSKYLIMIDVQATYIGPPPPPGGGVTGNTTAASDTDNVGGGTARVAANIPNFDSNNPITNLRIVNGNTSFPDIALNKRTSFDIVFN